MASISLSWAMFLCFSILSISIGVASPTPSIAGCTLGLSQIANKSDPYSLVALDASGHWIGDLGKFDNCKILPGAHFCVLHLPPLISANSSSGADPLAELFAILNTDVGLCLPEPCTSSTLGESLGQLANSLKELYNISIPINTSELNLLFSNLTCADEPNFVPQWTAGAFVMLSFCAAIFGVVLFCSAVEFFQEIVAEWKDGSQPLVKQLLRHDSSSSVSAANVFESDSNKEENLPLLKATLISVNNETIVLPEAVPQQPRLWKQLIRCFSVLHNVRRLFASERSAGVDFLNGIRVISLCWVISGHFLLWFLSVGITNVYYFFVKVSPDFATQLLWNAPFSVDTFFFLSGFLVALLTLKSLDSQRFSLPMYFIHRYLRLTPVLLFWIFFYWKLLPVLGSGPNWKKLSMATGTGCEYWWAQILYFGNFYPSSGSRMCMAWIWYLSNDMQFYVVVVFIILLFWKNRFAGSLLLALCMLATLLTNLALDIKIKAQVNNMDENPNSIQWFDEVYEKPYTRAPPYIVGVATAFILFSLPSNFRLPKSVHFAAYAAAAAAMCAVLLSPYDEYRTTHPKPWTNADNWSYLTLSRTSWAIGLAILTLSFSFVNGGGYGRSFLSASFWTPLARLSYSAYIVHGIWLTYLAAIQTHQWTYSLNEYFSGIIFSCVVSYGIAFLSYLFIEKPVMNLEALLFSKIVRESREQ